MKSRMEFLKEQMRELGEDVEQYPRWAQLTVIPLTIYLAVLVHDITWLPINAVKAVATLLLWVSRVTNELGDKLVTFAMKMVERRMRG